MFTAQEAAALVLAAGIVQHIWYRWRIEKCDAYWRAEVLHIARAAAVALDDSKAVQPGAPQ